MSRVTVRTLICNECEAEFGKDTEFLPAHILHRRARVAGWRWAGRNRDLCPAHAKERAS
ncbi:hypothetical protein ACIQ9J_21695 [Streptomyces sp. NPDC094153]|uniref:hypothetical protein n=1 Tax=Streptomyces sp. NPDC094153 TaxID=3366058 RepID=UPI00380D3871